MLGISIRALLKEALQASNRDREPTSTLMTPSVTVAGDGTESAIDVWQSDYDATHARNSII